MQKEAIRKWIAVGRRPNAVGEGVIRECWELYVSSKYECFVMLSLACYLF